MNHQTKLGTAPRGDEGKDAVHIAIVPVRAAYELASGQPAKLNAAGEAEECSVEDALGVVDPFRSPGQRYVPKGEWFWLCLFPGTITGLRHVWEHPGFPQNQETGVKGQASRTTSREESERWLREFIKNSNCPDYDIVIAAALGEHVNPIEDYQGPAYHTWTGEDDAIIYLHFTGRDAGGNIPPEFWDHVENLTGKKCPVRATSFTCSC